MIRFISLDEVLELHRLLLEQSGGMEGLRDLAMLESAVAQPLMTFDGQDLYPTLADKASAICYSLVMNHPFIDGNKRVGHATMETFLVLNGQELSCAISHQEKKILDLAAGLVTRQDFTTWVQSHTVPLGSSQNGFREPAQRANDVSAADQACPDSIGEKRVICYTPIDSRHRHTRKTRHIVNGMLQGPVAGLAICPHEQGYFLLYCDQHWEPITDGWQPTLEDAKRQAEFEYEGVSATWCERP